MTIGQSESRIKAEGCARVAGTLGKHRLRARLESILDCYKITTIDDLLGWSAEEVLLMFNGGPKCVEVLRDRLQHYGVVWPIRVGVRRRAELLAPLSGNWIEERRSAWLIKKIKGQWHTYVARQVASRFANAAPGTTVFVQCDEDEMDALGRLIPDGINTVFVPNGAVISSLPPQASA